MILRLNSRGPMVLDLQRRLNKLGFTITKSGPGSPGNETDFFGNLTRLAVINFQKSRKLKDDGVVGSKTWSELLKDEPVKISPIYTDISKEDFSDPEEEMKVDISIPESLPTCPNISELINLIQKSNITRRVNRLVFHCTATNQSATVASIERFWRNNLGWRSPGYHIIVKPDGSWTQLSDFNNVVNGVAGINSTSIHISYIGGIDSKGRAIDNRTDKQKEVFEIVWREFSNKMSNLTFHGHYEFSNKACPSFKVDNWIKTIEII